MNPRTLKQRALVALALAASAAGAVATPASIELPTGAGWTLRYNDVEASVGRVGPAFAYDCLGAGQPRCLSITSTGYAEGTWLPGATSAGFMGQWQAYIDFTLPAGATHVQLFYELLGFDDVAALTLSTHGTGLFIAQGVPGAAAPAGSEALDGVFAVPGTYRLALEVENNPGYLRGDLPRPIAFDDGTSVVGRFRVSFDLPDGTVPEPGSLACAAVALATAFVVRRRRPGAR